MTLTKEDKIAVENKLIADFMGYPGNKKESPYYYAMVHAYNNNNMRYHDSWDWLIPVYNRILLTVNNNKRLQERLKENFVVNFSTKNFFHLFNQQLQIASCYSKVIDFINWYNQENL